MHFTRIHVHRHRRTAAGTELKLVFPHAVGIQSTVPLPSKGQGADTTQLGRKTLERAVEIFADVPTHVVYDSRDVAQESKRMYTTRDWIRGCSPERCLRMLRLIWNMDQHDRAQL